MEFWALPLQFNIAGGGDILRLVPLLKRPLFTKYLHTTQIYKGTRVQTTPMGAFTISESPYTFSALSCFFEETGLAVIFLTP